MRETTVILLNWNGFDDTVSCLESLFACESTACRVFVCDNGSTDNSVVRLQSWAKENCDVDFACVTSAEIDNDAKLDDNVRLAIIENGRNLGFAAGNNVGIRLAIRDPACRYIWILNNDTVVAPDALEQAVARMRTDASIGLCGSTLVYFSDKDTVQAFGGASYNHWRGAGRHLGAFATPDEAPQDPCEIERAMAYVVGAAMLVRREFIEAVGVMNEDYFLYCEEIDWAIRGQNRFRLGYAPGSIVWHKEGASIGTAASGGSPLSMYYLYRSRMRVTARYFPWCLPTVLVACALDIMKLLLRRRWPQALASIQGVFQWSRAGMPHLALNKGKK